MLSENQKRKASLSVLEKLRQQGAPGRDGYNAEGPEDSDATFNDMFARLDEEGKIVSGEEEPSSKEKKKEEEKKRPPNLVPSGVEAMKSAFRKQR